MDTNFIILACCHLALSLATSAPPTTSVEYTSSNSLNGTVTVTPSLNFTHTTAMATPSNTTTGNTTFSTTVTLNPGTDVFTSATQDNSTPKEATTATHQSTNNQHTTQSTTIQTSTADNASLTSTVPSTQAPTVTGLSTQASQTTVHNTSTPNKTLHSTANVSPTVNTTSDSMNKSTQGLPGQRLNDSETIMTVLFSVALGVLVLGLVGYVFHRCKHKVQYSHQPLYNTEDTADRFVAADDTLVISGGLYDDHPIYDNQPTATAEQSEFRLEFLHDEERIPTF